MEVKKKIALLDVIMSEFMHGQVIFFFCNFKFVKEMWCFVNLESTVQSVLLTWTS